MVVLWIVSGLFLLLSLLLISGHGAWLIAGYNTASAEEKKKSDEKKLCRAVGVFMLILALGIAALALCSLLDEAGKLSPEAMKTVQAVFFLLVFLGSGFLIWFANTKCRR